MAKLKNSSKKSAKSVAKVASAKKKAGKSTSATEVAEVKEDLSEDSMEPLFLKRGLLSQGVRKRRALMTVKILMTRKSMLMRLMLISL